MVTEIETVQTQAMQLWFKKPVKGYLNQTVAVPPPNDWIAGTYAIPIQRPGRVHGFIARRRLARRRLKVSSIYVGQKSTAVYRRAPMRLSYSAICIGETKLHRLPHGKLRRHVTRRV